MTKTILRILLSAVIAWIAGLLFISVTLYFSNSGADFTLTDIMGFGVMAVVASGLWMLLVYLPALFFLKRRLHGVRPKSTIAFLTGVICNLPIFIVLVFLINRKMSLSEALGFIVTFLIIGTTFGLAFTWKPQLKTDQL